MKKILSIVLALLMLTSCFSWIVMAEDVLLISAKPEIEFNDVKRDSETGKAIYKLAEAGVLVGDGTGAFNPKNPISRAELSKIINMIFGYTEEAETGFIDVTKDDWFYSYLEYLVDSGLINGKTESTFEPYSTFSYAECSAVIVRYLGLEDEASKRMKEISARDASLSNQWYLGYFEVLANLGIFSDYDLFEFKNGKILSVDVTLANSPVVRYRFAESISKSFELNSDIKAKNVYSELGGSGREFIVGGGYKEEILEEYKDIIDGLWG